MNLLKYVLVILGYEILNFATGAMGSISLTAFGVVDFDEGLAISVTKLVVMKYGTTMLAIMVVAGIASRYDAMGKVDL